MSKERERKFKLKELTPAITSVIQPMKIQQGYLMLGNSLYVGKQLRIRIINDKVAFLCYKFGGDVDRDEFEYEIPLPDAIELMKSTNITIEKIRYEGKMYDPGFDDINDLKPITVAVDIYKDGDQVVEIEYEHDKLSDKLFEVLDWVGDEVTGQQNYSNIFKAIQNGKNAVLQNR